MALKILKLGDLIKTHTEEELSAFLYSFETISAQYIVGADDVQNFLRTKAIQFEKMDLARTYFVMSTYQSVPLIAGYFAISNKPLSISKRNFATLSKNARKRLMGIGYKTEQESYEISGYLLGQLGKNYSSAARKANTITGDELLTLSYAEIKKAHELIGGRILYLECENHYKVEEFYIKNGFSKIEQFKSVNGQSIMVKKLADL